ncbi:hypothetical protein PC9H_007646 [Pleurotus ostreatus]|uniref:Clathrin/coatomer adaptor adaptin-like N-terminal domain-containing protein n=2 Tax=Pleurotus ostreatus TaxID=5322 RepID=A0A067NLM4_PLEO1|nr:uncharacterized protein PC9H_007646 [Pleurotus ostreatus]KAF7428422.1 hypothetical protein PC9H_007646 [Pleurotus ostreatus]KDQ27905.1 hypothetical protein PLEOSDRAFT_158226 [Pleurotus ostreatus PC15]
MDVPFASSGAMNRMHYSLVRKVEEAPSPGAADQLLQEEARAMQHELSQPGLSQRRSKECLIMIMYCAMATTFGSLDHRVTDSALPHAVTLAESGGTIQNKRIGYLFCAQMMPVTHELQLMLVNTLRKDLESPDVPHICIALDSLCESPNELVIPAVQSRLHDLLSHSSVNVRRRALLAYKSLSQAEPTLVTQISTKLYKRMGDEDTSVATAAILTSLALVEADESLKARVADELNALWRDSQSRSHHSPLRQFLLVLLFALSSVGFSPVRSVRGLLTSSDVNDQYTFLSCLECLTPALWAGTTPDIPPVLEAWEVERVMQLLYSKDPLMRRKTLGILNQVDHNIVVNYYQQILQTVADSGHGSADAVILLLEIVEVQTASDGEAYAREVKELFRILEGPPLSPKQGVSEEAIQIILTRIMSGDGAYRMNCATALLTAIAEAEVHAGPTLIVLVSALAVEYAECVSVSPVHVMRGLGYLLKNCSAAVQDACLLAMLRLSALCEDIPNDIVEHVSAAKDQGGRYVKRRCDQFLALSTQRSVITQIVRSARSSSLPDFLAALQEHEARQLQSTTHSQSSEVPTPVSSPPKSEPRKLSPKLRYKAYELPPSTPPKRSHLATPRHSPNMIIERSPLRRPGLIDPLSNTVSPGELALAAGSDQLEISTSSPQVLDDISSRMDLIAFDTPTAPDEYQLNMGSEDLDFEATWDSLSDTSGARGWCSILMEGVLRILQQSLEGYRLQVIAVDYPPFLGELKILITNGSTSHALVRLKESEEDSCLWRMRCADAGLRTRLKRLFADEEGA